jgi:hypothetical protein
MQSTIGLVDVDGGKFPNYALMKISAFHKAQGDSVEWASPLFGASYDRVYMSKIFTFSPDCRDVFSCEVVRGGTGYDYRSALPDHIDRLQPDYSIYPTIDRHTAYGFLTRGCPNKCHWCVVPHKEGTIRPYRDVEEIAVDGRNRLILMDNNILASDYGLTQIEKIVRRHLRVDFNQALDARLVTDDVAHLLSRVRFLAPIRFGCDTPGQISECERAMTLIDNHRPHPAKYILYTMLHGTIEECYARLSHFRANRQVRLTAQPYRDYNNRLQVLPQWQRDMARWSMRRQLYAACDFKDFEPRKGFKCSEYFK